METLLIRTLPKRKKSLVTTNRLAKKLREINFFELKNKYVKKKVTKK